MKLSELEEKVGKKFAQRLITDETMTAGGVRRNGELGYYIIDLMRAFEHIIDPDYPMDLLKLRKRE